MNEISPLQEARTARRSMLRLLRDQQQAESNCIGQMRETTIVARRKLFNLMADWLISFGVGRRISLADSLVFQQTDFGIDSWFAAQKAEEHARFALDKAKRRESEEEAIYKQVASFGLISVWFKEGEEKLKAQRLRLNLQAAKSARDSAEAALRFSELTISSLIESFLRAISSPNGLKQVCEHNEIGPKVRSLLTENASSLESLWDAHAQRQLESVGDLESATATLSQLYERKPSTGLAIQASKS